MKMTSLTKRLVLVGLILIAGGCGSPMTYDLNAPAKILTPVGAAGVIDGRARYRQIFCGLLTEGIDPQPPGATCESWLHRLSDEPESATPPARNPLPLEKTRFFIVPGYAGDAAPANMMPWGASIETLLSEGFQLEYLMVSGGGSAAHNADQIAEALQRLELTREDRVVLIGYSKGTIDILHFVVNHPEMVAKVDAVVSIAGAVNGSPLADEIPDKVGKIITKMGGGSVGDAGGMDSLRRSVQMNWLARNPLPDGPQYFSLAAFTDRKNVSSILRGGYDRLALVDPRNDAQVIFYDQIIPASTLLGYANGDHWAVALPFQEQAKTYAATIMNRNRFPRTELLEAVLLYVQETLASP